MLLAVDIGNSNISIGLFDREGALRFLASLDTDRRKTADQICVDLMNLFQLYHYRYQDISDSILAAGKAAHGGRPRRKDRAEHPSGSADSDGSRYRGGCGGGFGELYGADHHH